MEQPNDRVRLKGIDETIKHARTRNLHEVRVRNPSAWVREKLTAQGHTFSEPDADGRVLLKISVEPELVIDNPDPPRTP